MGIDPMNNISNNNKNTLCSYIILIIDRLTTTITSFLHKLLSKRQKASFKEKIWPAIASPISAINCLNYQEEDE
jgi:hypothetical protein